MGCMDWPWLATARTAKSQHSIGPTCLRWLRKMRGTPGSSLVSCHKIPRKIHESLQPGGLVVVLEFIPNEDRVTPTVPASFSLMMLATTPSGDAYTYSEYQQLLNEAGFGKIELQDLNPTFFRVVLATK